jgi:hypothetical protein
LWHGEEVVASWPTGASSGGSPLASLKPTVQKLPAGASGFRVFASGGNVGGPPVLTLKALGLARAQFPQRG